MFQQLLEAFLHALSCILLSIPTMSINTKAIVLLSSIVSEMEDTFDGSFVTTISSLLSKEEKIHHFRSFVGNVRTKAELRMFLRNKTLELYTTSIDLLEDLEKDQRKSNLGRRATATQDRRESAIKSSPMCLCRRKSSHRRRAAIKQD